MIAIEASIWPTGKDDERKWVCQDLNSGHFVTSHSDDAALGKLLRVRFQETGQPVTLVSLSRKESDSRGGETKRG